MKAKRIIIRIILYTAIGILLFTFFAPFFGVTTALRGLHIVRVIALLAFALAWQILRSGKPSDFLHIDSTPTFQVAAIHMVIPPIIYCGLALFYIAAGTSPRIRP